MRTRFHAVIMLLAAVAVPSWAGELTLADVARSMEALRARPSDLKPLSGVILMAHGGSPAWNEAVLEATIPLTLKVPLEVAFGMADPKTLQAAVTKLEAVGARRLAVVRLFISGESFREETEKILGLKPGAPPCSHHPPGHDHRGGHDMPVCRISTRSEFVMSDAGFMESELAGGILAERAMTLSRNPAREYVLLLGHGPADDAENQRWLAHMERRADAVRRASPFPSVKVETLREDWPERRAEAERRIRAYVEEGSRQGGSIVIPFRLFGMGPYTEVLSGLNYSADGKGFLPHPSVTVWIREQAALGFSRRGWDSPF